MPRFKADLHIHNNTDPREREHGVIGLMSPCEIIDLAHKNGYNILSFTNHNNFFDDNSVKEYAENKGILLIPGIEAKTEGKHVLLYNPPHDVPLDSFDALRTALTEETLVCAPHPFYPGDTSLHDVLMENLDVFDALEHCHFHSRWWNPNKRTCDISNRYKLPLIGSSDLHCKWQFGSTYSLIDADELSVSSVIAAIKKGYVEVVSKPISVTRMTFITLLLALRRLCSIGTRSGKLPITSGAAASRGNVSDYTK